MTHADERHSPPPAPPGTAMQWPAINIDPDICLPVRIDRRRRAATVWSRWFAHGA